MILHGVSEVIVQEIIKIREEFGGRCLTLDVKSITEIPATTWQPWLNDG